MRQGAFLKLGAFAWLALAMTLLETLLSIKYGRGLYLQQWPRPVLLAWGLAGGLLVVVLAAWQARIWRRQRAGQAKAD